MKKALLLIVVVLLLAVTPVAAQRMCEECGGGGCSTLIFTSDAPSQIPNDTMWMEYISSTCDSITLRVMMKGDFLPPPAGGSNGAVSVNFHIDYDPEKVTWTGWSPRYFLIFTEFTPGCTGHISICGPNAAGDSLFCGHNRIPAATCGHEFGNNESRQLAVYTWTRTTSQIFTQQMDFSAESLLNSDGLPMHVENWYGGRIQKLQSGG